MGEKNYMCIEFYLKEINEIMTKINCTLGKTDYITLIVPSIVSLASVFLGYKISSSIEKKNFKRKSLISYLECTNDFLFEINKLVQDIVNFKKYSLALIDQQVKLDIIKIYKINDNEGFDSIRNKIIKLSEIVEKMEPLNDSNQNQYRSQILQIKKDFEDLSLVSKLTDDYSRKALNYYYLIPTKLAIEHTGIIKYISENLTAGMQNFDIVHLRESLNTHIQNINSEIIEKNTKMLNFFRNFEKNKL